MVKLSLWRPKKGVEFDFLDSISRQGINVGGLGILVHKYIGVIDQGDVGDASQPGESDSTRWDSTTIQDLTFIENRNREYADDVFEMKGHFNEADKDFDLMAFNLGIANGTKFVTFHLNDMIDKIGRKLMAGDVLEMPNLRDDALLDDNAPATNQWYVVTDASWPTEGFSPLWYPHLWRVKAQPMTDAPEYYDITRDQDGNVDPLRDLLTTYTRDVEINDAVITQAEVDLPARNFETRHVYVVPGDEFGTQYPWIFAGDGTPPNESTIAEVGQQFPDIPTEGDYFLRTDYEPARLFQYTGTRWRYVEVDLRSTVVNANRIMASHINNEETFTEDGETVEERQPISKAVKPKKAF